MYNVYINFKILNTFFPNLKELRKHFVKSELMC